MKLYEFKKYARERDLVRVIFSSDNQQSRYANDPCKLEMGFSEMRVFDDSNIICLKNNTDVLTIDSITEVFIDDKSCVLGDIVAILCNGMFGAGDYVYRLIFQWYE